MIYVHRDWSKIPPEALETLKSLSKALDELPEKNARKQFIKDNALSWAAVRPYLLEMSHGKCWYTEAKERVSRYHVDHFRPHGRAKQAEGEVVEGYCWLAFDVENLRIAGVLSNTQNREYSDETVGKGDWFPLVDPTKRATLTNRNTSLETPILLDPTDPEEVQRIVFNEDGRAQPAVEQDEPTYRLLNDAIRILAIDQDALNGARRSRWRQCKRLIDMYSRIARKPKGDRSAEEALIMAGLASELMGLAKAQSDFSSVARHCLSVNRLGAFVIRDELMPLSIDA